MWRRRPCISPPHGTCKQLQQGLFRNLFRKYNPALSKKKKNFRKSKQTFKFLQYHTSIFPFPGKTPKDNTNSSSTPETRRWKRENSDGVMGAGEVGSGLVGAGMAGGAVVLQDPTQLKNKSHTNKCKFHVQIQNQNKVFISSSQKHARSKQLQAQH